MPTYTPPLRDLQFVLHELFQTADKLKTMPRHAEVDADTMNAVLEEVVATLSGAAAELQGEVKQLSALLHRRT